MKTPKFKKGGVVTTTVLGVVGLIIAVIIGLVILDTILDAEIISDKSASTTITNDTTPSTINETGVLFSSLHGGACTVTYVYNASSGNLIDTNNYSVSGCTITYTANDGVYNNTLWNITGSVAYYVQNPRNVSAFDMSSNFTSGLDNISEKIPTILLIVAVVFLFGALVLLVANAKRMGIDSGGSL